MGDLRPGKTLERSARRWAFANCVFDEADWTLEVDGQRVRIETKPLEILRALLLRAGHIVSKDELLDLVWPNVMVVEASLPTAMRKLRTALGDGEGGRAIIETVSGIGYRFVAPVALVGGTPEGPSVLAAEQKFPERARWAAALLLAVLAATAVWKLQPSNPDVFASRPGQRAQVTAIRHMDAGAIERMLVAGWDPNATYDQDGTTALTWLINMCEWDPQHDRRKMLLIARAFIDHGADISDRNGFGDTPYSIAKAARYCGPDRPVTVLLRRMCVDARGQGGDRCMASYALARGERFPG